MAWRAGPSGSLYDNTRERGASVVGHHSNSPRRATPSRTQLCYGDLRRQSTLSCLCVGTRSDWLTNAISSQGWWERGGVATTLQTHTRHTQSQHNRDESNAKMVMRRTHAAASWLLIGCRSHTRSIHYRRIHLNTTATTKKKKPMSCWCEARAVIFDQAYSRLLKQCQHSIFVALNIRRFADVEPQRQLSVNGNDGKTKQKTKKTAYE